MLALPDNSNPTQVTTDWVGLIDEWAYRFFAEMDYVAEAASAMQFQQEMARLEGIVVPDVFTSLTSHFVLTTAWIEGARRSAAGLSRTIVACRCRLRPHDTHTAVHQMAAGVNVVVIEGHPACGCRPCETSCLLGLLTVSRARAGEKLSESRASDVRELCTTLLNAYLIQLLETGHLHADPHPGNLIRTPDGKICILDFGLMTEVIALPFVASAMQALTGQQPAAPDFRMWPAEAQPNRLTSRGRLRCSAGISFC